MESHRIHHTGWLRAAVLGANDGIVSTASLVMGVAASGASEEAILVAGVAGLVAGAMSMAAGEYVSVSSQADTEQADLSRERRELESDPTFELAELADIYQARGLSPELAEQVAKQLTPAACAPMEWSRRRNVMGVAVPALVNCSLHDAPCSISAISNLIGKANETRWDNPIH